MANPTGPSVSRPVGPYSPVLSAGGWVVTSGQIGLVTTEKGTELVGGGTAAELSQALANVASVLAQAGAELTDVITATLYLVDMADYALANEVWIEAFGDHRPARTAVAVSALPLGARVEVAVWAWPKTKDS
jgi:2-iminobutanoate/2-iminopropanoate deaminase